jgi:hypothetical protein
MHDPRTAGSTAVRLDGADDTRTLLGLPTGPGARAPQPMMPALVERSTARGYDVNDPLGIHGALDALPEDRWDEFFDDWVAVTERGNFEVGRISSLALHLTRDRISRDGAEDALSIAWQAVSRSMIRYLAATGALTMPSPVGWLGTRRR